MTLLLWWDRVRFLLIMIQKRGLWTYLLVVWKYRQENQDIDVILSVNCVYVGLFGKARVLQYCIIFYWCLHQDHARKSSYSAAIITLRTGKLARRNIQSGQHTLQLLSMFTYSS